MIDPHHRPKDIKEYIYWGIFFFVVVFTGQLLTSLVEMSMREQTAFVDSVLLTKKQYVTVMVLDTTRGDITIRFDRGKAPSASNNVIQFASSGFYDGTKIHRIQKDVLIQGGDPLSREEERSLYGTGGPGYVFEDENTDAVLVRGTVALANRGKPNTNGSQFFIVTANELPAMEGKYTVIGKVIDGFNVLDVINGLPVDENEVPEKPVIIKEVRVE